MNNNTGDCNPGLDCINGNNVDCCKPKVTCKYPKCLNDISTECIFVEKVFDARITKRKLEFTFPTDVFIQPTNLVSIKTINAECNLLSVETSINKVKINKEFIDISTTVPGPGGTQVVLNREQLKKIQDTDCTEKGKGTKVQLNILVRLLIIFNLNVNGTGIDSNGQLVPFTGSIQVIVGVDFTLSFKDFCIPPLSLFPISLITSCLMSCDYILFDFEFTPNDDSIFLNGQLFFCPICETLLKVPSQICALTTGPCKIEKNKSFCDDEDFPDDLSSLMPNQNKKITSSMKKTNGWSPKMDNKTQKSPLTSSFGTNQFQQINSKK